MKHSRRVPLLAATVAVSVFGLVSSAHAHNWGCWRQPNRTVYTYNTAVLSSQASAALSDWDNKTILSIPRVNSHTEVSVFDGYYGNTGWAGIASIESASGCNILHGHARVNRSYSYTSNGYRGIFCQEVGHLFGLDHSNDGGCMGGGYFYSINTYYTVVQHNINDIATKYSGVPLAAAFPASAGDIQEGQTRAIAFWNDRPHTLEEARAKSEVVVEAHVIQVVHGPDLVVAVDGLEHGDRIPTQRILMSVDRVISGTLNGRVFELFKTGSDEFTIAEDAAYVPGERYVLFLTTKERGTYRVIAPEGRLRVTDEGLVPSSAREFMSGLRGKNIESFISEMAHRGGESPDGSGLQLRRNADRSYGHVSISYALPRSSRVTLRLFDARGRLVRTLVDSQQDGPRWYTVEWDGQDAGGRMAASGVFYAKLDTSAGTKSLAIVRIR